MDVIKGNIDASGRKRKEKEHGCGWCSETGEILASLQIL